MVKVKIKAFAVFDRYGAVGAVREAKETLLAFVLIENRSVYTPFTCVEKL